MRRLTGLYPQVLLAIMLGVAVGHIWPEVGASLKPLGDGFIKLVKMVIAPIIFCTIVVGIASLDDLKKVGRVGIKAILYFEAVTTIALVIGLIAVNLVRPGAGINADPATLDASAVSAYAPTAPKTNGVTEFLLAVIPTSVVDAFARSDILQVLLFSLLFGAALARMRERGRPIVRFLDQCAHAMFGVIAMIMRLAPLGAFGAMAFAVGSYGFRTLGGLALLMASFYVTCILFVFVVLGLIAWWSGFSIVKFLRYIREEILVVVGTSSSESVLPRMLNKLERLGCPRPIVGLVIPTGYSFNLDGTSIYLTMAVVFIAQACNIDLSLTQQASILGVLLLTSKGAAAVSGGGFVTLAATLASVSDIPVAGLALILGIDRFMSEARALTNLIGNGVATLVVAKWEGELDLVRLRRELDGGGAASAEGAGHAAGPIPAVQRPHPARPADNITAEAR
jgi:aerobic C4-dicarboxylate transport protein